MVKFWDLDHFQGSEADTGATPLDIAIETAHASSNMTGGTGQSTSRPARPHRRRHHRDYHGSENSYSMQLHYGGGDNVRRRLLLSLPPSLDNMFGPVTHVPFIVYHTYPYLFFTLTSPCLPFFMCHCCVCVRHQQAHIFATGASRQVHVPPEALIHAVHWGLRLQGLVLLSSGACAIV